MRLTAFIKLYKMCTLLHRCDLKILAENRFEKSAIFVKMQQHFCKCCNICKFLPICRNLTFQLDNLVDFEKCWKTRIFLQKTIGPGTAENERNFAENLPNIGNFSDYGSSPVSIEDAKVAQVRPYTRHYLTTKSLTQKKWTKKRSKFAPEKGNCVLKGRPSKCCIWQRSRSRRR